MGMPTAPTPSVSITYKQHATPPISGAPGLPTPCELILCYVALIYANCYFCPVVFQMGEWPQQDHVPDTSKLLLVKRQKEVSHPVLGNSI
jgi:hypothetical protein